MTKDVWKKVRFDQMARVITQRVDPAEATESRYVGLEHLDSENLTVQRWGSPSDVKGSKYRVTAGQIIFGKRRFYQRKVAVAPFDCICSAHAMVLEENSDLIAPGFLAHFMLSDPFVENALAISEGSLSPTIKWKRLAVQEFDLPPEPRQRTIVAMLTASVAAVAAAQTAVGAAQASREALLATLKGPTSLRISEVADIRLGRQRSPDRTKGVSPARYLRAANIGFGDIDFDDVLEMDFDARERSVFELRPGDVLLVEGNASASGVGVPAQYRDGMPSGMYFQNTLVRLRTRDPEVLRPDYLYASCQAAYLRGEFAALASGTNIKHLGARTLASLPIWVPSPSEQDRFVEMIGISSATVAAAEAHLEALVSAASALRSKLMRPSCE